MEQLSYNNNPIGVFDSGVGGISVMKKAIELMPNENYIYYGDSKNAPYGIKTPEQVRRLSFDAIEFLLKKGAKAIVVACNTATSAAIVELREYYKQLPIIGIEPALKPAVESNKNGKIIIMATPMTLAESKFKDLMNKYDKKHSINPLPVPGLVEFIEQGILDGEELNLFLKEALKPHIDQKISTVVLGCTHYPFVKEEISNILGDDVKIIDGSLGTAKELRRKLKEHNLLNLQSYRGYVEIYNSLEDKKIIQLSRYLIDK